MIKRLIATCSPFLFFRSIFHNCSVSLKNPLISTFLDRLALSTSFTIHNRPIYFVCHRARHVWLGARSSFQESITRPPKATFFDRKAKLFNRQVRAAVRSRQPSSIRPSRTSASRPGIQRPGERVAIRTMELYANTLARDARLYGRNAILCYRWPATGQ